MRRQYNADGTYFNLPERYTAQEVLGQGAYGVVCSALDNETGGMVAVKKVVQPFKDLESARKLVREVRLLSHFNKHSTVLGLKSIIPPEEDDYSAIYFSTDLLHADLRALLKSNKFDFSPGHQRWFTYQLLSGVNAIHSCGVLHRDLKPENIFIDQDCSLRIGDFGLARDDAQTMMSIYVVTRWYRSPELLMNWNKYNFSVDIWSVGCIFAEMLATDHKPLFPGRDYLQQLHMILQVIGTPSEEEYSTIGSEYGRNYVKSMPKTERVDIRAFRWKDERSGSADSGKPYFPPDIPDDAIDLLFKMLRFSPDDRPQASELLTHPYLEDYAGDDGEECEEEEEEEEADEVENLKFDPRFENEMTSISACKEIFNVMVQKYNPDFSKKPWVKLHDTVTSTTHVLQTEEAQQELYDATLGSTSGLSPHSLQLLSDLESLSPQDTSPPEAPLKALNYALLGPEKDIISKIVDSFPEPRSVADLVAIKKQLITAFKDDGLMSE